MQRFLEGFSANGLRGVHLVFCRDYPQPIAGFVRTLSQGLPHTDLRKMVIVVEGLNSTPEALGSGLHERNQ